MLDKPKEVWSWSRRMLWSMVSKAQLMSSDTRSGRCPGHGVKDIISVMSCDVSLK